MPFLGTLIFNNKNYLINHVSDEATDCWAFDTILSSYLFYYSTNINQNKLLLKALSFIEEVAFLMKSH